MARTETIFAAGLSRQLIVAVALMLGVNVLAATAQEDTRQGYVLGPGDKIQIQVHGEDDLSIQLRLGGDGYISYPFLGEIEADGLTVAELQHKITEGLKGDYLVDPDVRVFVLEYRPVYINGEVKNPGGYAYVPGLNVQKAVSLAGGFTELASKNKIYIVREGHSSNRRQQVDLDTEVGPGDTVIVEEGFF